MIAIVGATATGKSELAMKAAKLINQMAADSRLEPNMAKKPAVPQALSEDRQAGLEGAEIICGDSRTIYKYADIGTAKPSTEDQMAVPHWGIDLVEPGERFTAAQFQAYALEKIIDIRSRGKLPIVAGGSGLYIDGLLYGFEFRDEADPEVRAELEALDVEELQEIIKGRGLDMPQNERNKRHLVRTLETGGQANSKQPLPKDVLVIGLTKGDIDLQQRISRRVEAMYRGGLVHEVLALMNKYGPETTSNLGIGYNSCVQFIRGEIDEESAKASFAKGDWQYARRQKTWFKRNSDIQWVNNSVSGLRLINEFIVS